MVLRLHTFLFADIVGFTHLTDRHGDEHAADLAVRFHEQVCELAAELGCEVVKAIGDAVMVRSENSDTAVALAERILQLTGRDGFPPARVGLDTGPAVERGGDWFGSTVNTACRVTAAAGAGELLMTERARRAVCAGRRRVAGRGRHELKGLPSQQLFGIAPLPGGSCAAALS
jgi:class 3 adenylate cyclase